MNGDKRTKADKLLEFAKKSFTFGTGPDAQPWAWEIEARMAWSLTDPKPFGDRLADLWAVANETIIDSRHVTPVVSACKAAAQRGLPLETITDEMAGTGQARVIDTDLQADGINAGVGTYNGVHEVLNRMEGRSDIFVSGTDLAQVLPLRPKPDQPEEDQIRPVLRTGDLASWCDRSGIRFYQIDKKTGLVSETFVPDTWAIKVITRGQYPSVPVITGISHVPVIRPDWSIADGHGHDQATGWWLDIPPDLTDLEVPDEPTVDELWDAVDIVTNLYAEFPFGLATQTEELREASRANAIGLLLTVPLKGLYPDLLVPVHIASAARQGSGKTLIAGDIPAMASGSDTAWAVSFTDSDAEVRKTLTTALISTSNRLINFDNVDPKDIFNSPSLARMLTADTWSDRMLGVNRAVTVPMDRIIVATGNKIRVAKDMAARSVLIQVDPNIPHPEAREFSLQLDIAAERLKIRRGVVTAVLTIVRAWGLAGAPEADAVRFRQFTPWARKVGGLLDSIGIEGHLTNVEELAETDEIEAGLAVLWEELWAVHQGDEFLTGDAVELIDIRSELDEELPYFLREVVQRWDVGMYETRVSANARLSTDSRTKLANRLGNTFKQRCDEFYGDFRLNKGITRHGKRRGWYLTRSEGREGREGQ